MATNVGSRSGPMVYVNVTPMIDVLLVLLIIFMIITPMTPVGLPAMIPQPAPRGEIHELNQRSVVVIVHKDGSLSINQQPIAESQLRQRLLDIFRTRGERVIFVEGTPNLDFDQVASVIDIARGAGIKHIGLLTKEVQNAG